MKSYKFSPLREAPILIVDDRPNNLKILAQQIREAGYKVAIAENGKSAIEQGKQNPPMLILLDVVMPDLDGFETCQQLKSQPETKDVPIIFMTALNDIANKVKGLSIGGVDYITKPFQIEEVLARIKNQLTIQELQQELKSLNRELEQQVKQQTVQLQQEMSEREQAQEKMMYMSRRDALTGLPNRVLLMAILEKLVHRVKDETDTYFALLSLDCDRFKIINDSLGNVLGDQLLMEIAARLKLCVRVSDALARLGGDEFIIVLTEIQALKDAIAVVHRIQEKLTKPFYLENHEIFITASIGIVFADENIEQPSNLLRDADTAMYQAKKKGGDRYEIFDPSMHASAMNRLQLENDLRRAVKQEEFQVYYQPIVSCQTNQITGFEALIRWFHPEKSMISPGKFIPIAEDNNLIIPIGKWILRHACQQLYTWQQQQVVSPSLTISVNLSVKQFAQPDLIAEIDGILEETNLSSSNLKLEITESALMENAESAYSLLQKLRKRQIQLSIDDFGTGYSSLSYLHRFPVNTLKIDRSFINRMEQPQQGSDIVKAIISLAHNLDMDVIAEGVETSQQWEQLQKLNCDYGQGYFFSPPVSSDRIKEILISCPVE
ncbi:MAG: EAL domain-containing protein [Okeania sp. SIO3I5]|uniref:two-component system response regulator n=1 Tax=Okeania sp. SIO3I5 TaxID=2607805 RepID=UPI0013B9468B|nr:EAL domain-containing response regulator [Okeania sp. SIO3I5]NEQ35442.1 EAL domain-containing protein [Okeania sp. SIO3I5]